MLSVYTLDFRLKGLFPIQQSILRHFYREIPFFTQSLQILCHRIEICKNDIAKRSNRSLRGDIPRQAH